ncbi:asparaginase [Staphylococcus arlettae]|uniref:asparaginase n=2 Tax=Staphylococcus arlettae TaxID=29378 RepID=A0A2T7BW22_9STAP|nr:MULTISPECIES: asparaginase [Staphylococcus]KAB2480072.1 asparaginase [Staphylococcus sp. CH99b_3]MBF0737565.1 asparaginase [Staphylococcus arlettae]MBK3718638.1 L-asparaginase precursor [Staphylococcus arlettae]MCD8833071.1 asparaginase [Staphylococcus arlettae]MCD8838144.1 asparaginase [Staphylococcus arlettae]
MKKLLVIHTGGTISMSQDESNQVVTNANNPISNHAEVIEKYADVTEITPMNVPSPHIQIHHIQQLKQIIEEAHSIHEYDGYVITHGTDTLEETAYLLDLSMDITQPVVITGAMRSSNEIGSDGLYNFISAIRVASTDEAANNGVMVVFNDEIHTARNVTKTHTSNTNTFQSPNHGPLGVITKNSVQFHHRPYDHMILNNINAELNIPLIKAYMGMKSDVLSFYSNENVDGIIIEALGQGNLPPTCLEGLQQCLAKNIPIVLVSRSFNGIVGPIYAYEGGGATLEQKGVIFSNGLNGPKARLKLLVGLSNNLSYEQLKKYFESQL